MNDNPNVEAPRPDSGTESGIPGPALTDRGRHYLNQTQPWVRFMGILNFVGAGLMVVLAFVILITATIGGMQTGEFGEIGRAASVAGRVILAVLYVVLAVLYIPAGLFLYRYAGAIRLLRTGGTTGDLEAALKHQRSFWRYVGVLSAIGIAVALIVFAVALLLGVFLAMRQGRA
jgi:hypothetical protein